MEDFKFYEVGGKIRDELLGLTNKDVDYVAVPTEAVYSKIHPCEAQLSPAQLMFKALKSYLEEQKFEIFLVTPECYTIRAKFPEGYKYQGVADFVMARKEVGYVPGTRIPIVEPGNLYDDLSRRDFTVNAMAKDPDTGRIIDYFGGMEDLKNRILRTPLDPETTFNDDPLRILRGLRFSITKGFRLDIQCCGKIHGYDYEGKMEVVSEERIREELNKMFKCNTLQSIKILEQFSRLRDYIFTKTKLWLKPTTEQ
jgi:tRNA nucleotidyltransferase/poly(A) polymerase